MNIGVLTSIGLTLDAFFPPLTQVWEGMGHSVRYAAGTPAQTRQTSVIRSLSRRPALKNLLASKDIARWAQAQQLDVVVTNTATASFWSRVRKMPVPVIYFCHGLHWQDFRLLSSMFWTRLESAVLCNTAGVITINSDDEKWFRCQLPSDKIFRAKSGVGVPLEFFEPVPSPATNGQFRLVWIGELSHRKRPQLAVKVMRELLHMGVNADLTMYGEGNLRALVEDDICRDGLSESVHVCGQTTQVSQALGKAHALLHTASWEGLPRVCLEALAVGRRTFAFDVKGVRDIPEACVAPDSDSHRLAQVLRQAWETQSWAADPRVRGTLDTGSCAHEIGVYIESVVSRMREDGVDQ